MDFAIGLVNSVLNLPNGQVKCLEESNLLSGLKGLSAFLNKILEVKDRSPIGSSLKRLAP